MTRALLAAALVLGVEGLAAQAAAAPRRAIALTVQLGEGAAPDSAAARVAADALRATDFRLPTTVPCPTDTPRADWLLARVATYPSTGAGIATVRELAVPSSASTSDAGLRRAVERADLHPILPHRAGSDTLPAIITLLVTATPRGHIVLGEIRCAPTANPPEGSRP